MTALGDLLAAVHEADGSFETVDSRWLIVEEHGDPDGVEARLRMAGERWREDRDDDTVVSDGDRWWSTLGFGGPETGTGQPMIRFGEMELRPLLAPGRLLGAYRFDAIGECEVAGRPVLLARATPRPRDPDHGMLAPWESLGDEADEHLLSVDRERGVVLRCLSRWEGEQVASAEVTEIAFDVPVGDEVFTLDRAATPVDRRIDVVAVTDPTSVAAELPFTLYFPEGLNGFQITAAAPPGGAGSPPAAFVHLIGSEGRINIHQHPADAMIELGPPRRGHPEARLSLQRGDTKIFLTSTDVDETRLAEIARTLVPVAA